MRCRSEREETLLLLSELVLLLLMRPPAPHRGCVLFPLFFPLLELNENGTGTVVPFGCLLRPELEYASLRSLSRTTERSRAFSASARRCMMTERAEPREIVDSLSASRREADEEWWWFPWFRW